MIGPVLIGLGLVLGIACLAAGVALEARQVRSREQRVTRDTDTG